MKIQSTYIIQLLKSTLVIVLLSFVSKNESYSQNISLKAEIDSNDILIGDWINYSLELSHAKNIEVLWPAYTDTSFGRLEILDQTQIDTSQEENKIVKKQSITLTSFDSGRHVIPALKFIYKRKDDALIRELITDTFIVDVSLIEVDTSKAIKPIKGPIKLPLTFREILPYILILVGLGVAVLVIIYFVRKKKNRPILIKKRKPKVPPHIIAIDKLKNLENEKLWQKGEIKNYHIFITDIIREYIENRFEIPALESTTEEIRSDIRKFDIEENILSKLLEFLELSDLVKFAKLKPLPDDNEKCLQVSYEFINKTKPISLPPEMNNKAN